MPKTDASVAFSVTDNLSQSIVGMKNSVNSFKADISQLQKNLDKLDSTKFQLKNFDLKKAKQELESTKKAFEKLGASATEADRAAAKADFEKANQNYENVRRQLDLVSKQARQTEKDMLNATNAISKADNRASKVSGGSDSVSVLGALGKAGLGQMAGNAALEITNTMIGSAFGSSAGSALSSGLSGAISGAAMGSLAGPLGTAIGAAVGGAIGLAQGGAQVYQAQDEAFKSYYQQLYEQGKSAAGESLTSGSSIASGRETDLISFSTLFQDKSTAEQYLANLVGMANTTPFLYDDLTAMSKTLATYGYGADSILPVLQTIGDAGAALGMDTGGMTAVAQALGRMKSSDKTTLEYLNILNDRGIGAVGMLANAYGVDQGTIYSMISKGEISGTKTVEVVLSALEKSFAGSMEEQSKTFAGLTSTLEGLNQELDNARGEGYNGVRTGGLSDEIAAYGGALGEAIQSLNRIAGENEAYMENLSEQYTREALSAVLLGQDTTLFGAGQQAQLEEMRESYLQASAEYADGSQEAGLKMDSLRQQAEALATAAYESSEAYQTVQQTELDQIDAIRENTAALTSWKNAYALQQRQTIGRSGTHTAYDPSVDPNSADFWVDYGAAFGAGGSHAYGLNRVPYDNFPALLHEGERVLTAREARQADQGGGTAVSISGNTFIVRQESDVSAIAEELLRRIETAQRAGVR